MIHRSRWSVTTVALAALSDHSAESVLGVENAVGVALLGEEALAVSSEVSVDGVPGDDRVEPCRRASDLGRSRRPRRWASPVGSQRAPIPG